MYHLHWWCYSKKFTHRIECNSIDSSRADTYKKFFNNIFQQVSSNNIYVYVNSLNNVSDRRTWTWSGYNSSDHSRLRLILTTHNPRIRLLINEHKINMARNIKIWKKYYKNFSLKEFRSISGLFAEPHIARKPTMTMISKYVNGIASSFWHWYLSIMYAR